MMAASAETSQNRKLQIFSLTYLALLLLLLVLWRIVGERHWLLIALLYMPQALYLIPALVLLTVALVTRRKREAVINLVSVVTVIFLFMHFRVHLPFRRHAPHSQTLRVLTYNIYAGRHGAEKVASVLKESGADIIFLQEARKPQQGNYPDPVPLILAHFPRWHFARSEGLVILSRHPLSNRKALPLGQFRKCLTCRVKVGNQSIRLINVHFSTAASGQTLTRSGRRFREYLRHTAAVRKEETHALLKIIQADTSPLIVAGDFNSPPNSYPHHALTRDLVDCFDRAGWGFGMTYSSTRPLWRIDYIFVRGNFAVARCQTFSARASDHRPVMADLSLPP